MYDSIFDPKNKVTIVKETGTYPRDNNCYHVKVLMPGKLPKPDTELEIQYLPKSEYDLAMHTRTFSKILNKGEYKKLIELIDAFGEQKYEDATDNCEMNHSEDL